MSAQLGINGEVDHIVTNGETPVVNGYGVPVSGGPRGTKVVVVGAGIAGVTAAAKLIQNGIPDVVVLEAQDYVGGRIKAQQVDGEEAVLDMGAMFVHGQMGNPIFEIVQRLGVEGQDLEEIPINHYTSNGEKVPSQEVDDLYELFEEKKRAAPAEIGHKKGAVMQNLYNQFLKENKIGPDHPSRELYNAVFRHFNVNECTEEACSDLNEVSAWCDFNYLAYGGKQYTLIKGGYTTVMNSLLDLVPEGVIRTRTPVQSIDWSSPEDRGVLVRCANGDVYSADHVIATISLGCLKSLHKSMFYPSLPDSLSNSLERVEMGSIGKVFIKWDEPFWNKKTGAMYNFLWMESGESFTMEQDKSKRQTCYGKPWWEDICGCHSIGDNGHCLLFWFLRHQMDAIKDVDDQEILAVLHELMQKFIPDVNIPKPSAIFRTYWESNPYTRGTYAFCIPSFNANDAENLNRPVFPSTRKPRLLFAGESFSMECITTTHGAFMTGEEQAERVLKANGISESIRVVDSISY